MTDDHADPGAEAAARAAQLAAMTISVAEALARLRSQRWQDRAIGDERVAMASRAQARVEAAAARLVWTPALDDGWLRGAPTTRLVDAWSAAEGHNTSDPSAAQARQRIEQRLRQLHAEAMHVYDAARADGHAAVAGLAYPIDIQHAMRTAPQAAEAMRALPPAPVRPQLTATRSTTRSTTGL